MPAEYRCANHTAWSADHLADVMAHVDSDHEADYMTLRDNGVITAHWQRQNEAQGNPDRRIFMCRRCNVNVTRLATDPLADHPYCLSCMGEQILEAHGG